MSTGEEIEQAAEKLAPTEFARLAAWVSGRNHALGTQPMEPDGASGKLDFVFAEVETERPAGQLHDWPAGKK